MAAAWPESIGVGPVVLDGVLLVGRSTRQRLSTGMAHTAESESRPLGDEAYLARLKVLRQQRDVIVERRACGLPGERAIEWLRAVGASLQATDVSKEKADLMHAIYDRITVAGHEIVGVRLTQAAYAQRIGACAARKVELARPTGLGRADATIFVRVPIAPRPW